MNLGFLSDHFTGVAFKTLSVVEADANRSNQHEYNGVRALQQILGLAQPRKFPARFVWMSDTGELVEEEGVLTWYDARARHPVRSEYRLYFPSNRVTKRGRAGDTLFIAVRPNGIVVVFIVPADSAVETSLAEMLDITIERGTGFHKREYGPGSDKVVAFSPGPDTSREALEQSFVETAWEVDEETLVPSHDPGVHEGVSSIQRAISRHDPDFMRDDSCDDWTNEGKVQRKAAALKLGKILFG